MSSEVLNALGQTQSGMIHRLISNTYIVEMGIIKAIPAEGIVTVEFSASDTAEHIVTTNCILASFASSSVTVNITPNIDDKVIVLFPRMYSAKMFNPEQNETVVSEGVSSYSQTGGIAILMNQYQSEYHKNYIDFSNGCLTIKLAYSEDDEDNLLSITTQADGSVTLNSNDTSISIDSENVITVDNGSAVVSIDADGNIAINAKGGKISLKNDSSDLFTILNGMLQILNTTLSTSGSPSKQVVDPQQFQQQATDLGNLMQ